MKAAVKTCSEWETILQTLVNYCAYVITENNAASATKGEINRLTGSEFISM